MNIFAMQQRAFVVLIVVIHHSMVSSEYILWVLRKPIADVGMYVVKYPCPVTNKIMIE